jgi:hypothetical protein
MFLVDCEVRPSLIPGAGKGIFLTKPVMAGKVIAAPDRVPGVISSEDVALLPPDSVAYHSAVCWFEDKFCTMEEWSDECYINHAFDPNCLWHLSFVIARTALPVGTELTIDYRHLLGEGVSSEFHAHETGAPFMGLSFKEIMRWNAAELVRIFAE